MIGIIDGQNSRAAAETKIAAALILIVGEISTNAYYDFEKEDTQHYDKTK